MIIDFHVHYLYGLNGSNGLDATLAAAERNGIDVICVSSLGSKGYCPHPSFAEINDCNDASLIAAKKHPGKVVPFAYLNPSHGEKALDELRRTADLGVRGIKLWIAREADDPVVFPVAELAIELSLPILQHSFNKTTGNLRNESTSANVAKLARRYPELTVVMPHLAGNGYIGVADVETLPNALVDTSGGPPVSGILEHAVERLGPHRILFGSDAPGRGVDVQLGRVLGARISENDKCRILGGNAARILNL